MPSVQWLASMSTWNDLLSREIVVVSGKGGTGKSTVAAALALAAAAGGRSVLLTEVEGRGEIERTLGVPDPGYRERAVAPGMWGLSIAPDDAAREYLALYVGLDRVSRAVLKAGLVDQLISLAPGFRDLLIAGKLYEVVQVRRTRPDRDGRAYDLVVVDAPPTGQLVPFLTAPSAFADLLRVGRVGRQSAGIDRLLRERATVVLVAVPEEMSVTETLEAAPAVEAAGVPIGAIVANRRRPDVVPNGAAAALRRLDGEALAAHAASASLRLPADGADRILEAARADAARVWWERRLTRTLRRAGPVLELPDVGPGHNAAPGHVARTLAGQMLGPGANGPALGAGPPKARGAGRARRGRSDRGAPRASPDLGATLAGARIVVVCGSGGVGKTTVSAAVAVALADRGRETALLTVDPARRLATALRLPKLAGERTRVRLGQGRSMEAMQLDTQRTFDDLIARYAPSHERRDRILSNRFYRRIADTLAGTHEYMAMEKLYELATDEDHEAIVIDTPPTRSALSFLDAPNRVTDFLGGRLLRWLSWPGARAGRLTLGAARLGATAFARIAGRLVGGTVLSDVAVFLSAFEGMYGGFKDRASAVLALLRDPACVFLVVASPAPASLEEAAYFVDRLGQGGMCAGAVVVNRWLGSEAPPPPGIGRAVERLGRDGPDARAAAGVLASAQRRAARATAQADALRAAGPSLRGTRVVLLPELRADVQDLEGLRRMAEHLLPRLAPAAGRGGRSDGRDDQT